MSREISQDFTEIITYIEKYRITSPNTDNKFKSKLSEYHKKYFAYLTYISELQLCVNKTISTPQFEHLLESCSDSGVAYFNTFHGSYKSAKLLQRSSIENFIKGSFLDDIPGLNTEKNMYTLFEKVSNLPFVKNTKIKNIYNRIHQEYKSLCADVHTAGTKNMAHISALNHFPSVDLETVKSIVKTGNTLIPSFMAILGLKYNMHFHSIHFKNKDIIIKNVARETRPLLNDPSLLH